MALKNSQYNLIMRQYDLARQSAAAKVQQHRQEVYAQVPGFSRLDEMIAETAGNFARAKISGQSINPDTCTVSLKHLRPKKQPCSLLPVIPQIILNRHTAVPTVRIPVSSVMKMPLL